MGDMRKSDRINFSSMGLIVGKRKQTPCMLENLSLDGASLVLQGLISRLPRIGDVILLRTTFLSPVELQCRVMRATAGRIAVEFIDL